jgi:hypothetical protein
MIFNIDARGHELFPTGFCFHVHIDVLLVMNTIFVTCTIIPFFRFFIPG